MKYLNYLLVLFLISSFYGEKIIAQETVRKTIGTKIDINSEVFSESREIQVYLPTSYETTTTEYPVLYLLNGKRWFLNGVSLQQTFTLDPFTNEVYQGLTPEFIVVGITTDTSQGRQRYNFYTSGADKLRAHLKNEVVAYVDENYRTNDVRMLFGWEYAAAFTIETLFKNPELFSAYFAASPFPLEGERLKTIDSLLPTTALSTSKFLYFATTPDEGQVTDGASQLDSILKSKAPESLRYLYEVLEYEKGGIGHLTTPFGAMYQGLRGYYNTYPDYNRIRRENIIATTIFVVILIAIIVLIVLGIRWLRRRLKRKSMASTTVIIILTIIGLTTNRVSAQESSYTSESIVISSTSLNEDRTIDVFLPEDYNDSSKQYPVLYLLNGEKWFLHGVNLQHIFTDLEITPEFIVVGINTYVGIGSERNDFFMEKAPQLLSFLEEEVITTIDKMYRTSEERLLFGWEYAGAFVIESLFQKPALFNAHFSASPFPLIREGRIQRIKDGIDKNVTMANFLYVTTSPQEGPVITGVDSLVTVLESKKIPNLNWEYEKLDYEKSNFAHTLSPYGTLYKGLRSFYYNYTRLEFSSVKDFDAAGGLKYVHEYYKKRAARYHTSDSIPTEGMFALVRMALQENSYITFDTLMQDFIERGFLETVGPRTAVQYAQYYMRNNGYEGAQSVYESLAALHPDEPTPMNGLGHVYEMLKDKVRARQYYIKAVELAKAGRHPNLAKFEQDLQSLN